MYRVMLHTSSYVVRDRAVVLKETPSCLQARQEAARSAYRLFGQTARLWPIDHNEFVAQRYLSVGIDRSHLIITIETEGQTIIDV